MLFNVIVAKKTIGPKGKIARNKVRTDDREKQ